jgi:hypothetical protein
MMMTRFSKPSWADELGIRMDELRAEHPFHPTQLANHRKINRQAERYWANERFLARVGDGIAPETPVEPAVKTPKKPAKVRRYEFTDRQLEIAMRSLNEKGAV